MISVYYLIIIWTIYYWYSLVLDLRKKEIMLLNGLFYYLQLYFFSELYYEQSWKTDNLWVWWLSGFL